MAKTVDHKQIKNIRLNITNIRSSLVSANKTLASLRSEKELLIKKQIEEKKLKDKEAKMEQKAPITPLGKFIDSPIKSAQSLIEKIVQFGATVLIGQLISTWPKLMDNFRKWKEDNKLIIDGVVKTFEVIGSGITGFVKWIGGINTSDIEQRTAQIDKETDNVVKNLDVVAQEASDAAGMADQKEETSGTPDNNKPSEQKKAETDIEKKEKENKKLKDKEDKPKKSQQKPNLSGGTPDTSGESTFPAKGSKLKTPNAAFIKSLSKNKIDSILGTPSGQFSDIANIRVTEKLKSEIRQHMSSVSVKPVSNQKDKVIEKLNSKPTGNKTKTTVVVMKQTEEKIVPQIVPV